MFSLDPAKLLLIAVVALVVLGPDKLPAAARKISSLMKDLQKMRASLESEAKKFTGDLPFGDELRSARDAVGRITNAADPRQALYRAAGLSDVTGTAGGSADAGTGAETAPGSIDISHLQPAETDRGGCSPHVAAAGASPFATVSASASPNAASTDTEHRQH